MRVLVALVSVLLAATTAMAADLTGEWEFAAKILNDVSYARGSLKTDGDKLSGTIGSNTVAGTTKGDDVTFTASRPGGQPASEFRATLIDGELRGTASSWPGVAGEVTWT